MSADSINVTAEYDLARARANSGEINFGEEMIDLQSIRRNSFIHGYAAALIDMKYGTNRKKDAAVKADACEHKMCSGSIGTDEATPCRRGETGMNYEKAARQYCELISEDPDQSVIIPCPDGIPGCCVAHFGPRWQCHVSYLKNLSLAMYALNSSPPTPGGSQE